MPRPQRIILGDRPPSYMSKATLAAELDMSESTVDSYVQRGLLPKPIKRGGSVRWCWAEVDADLRSRSEGDADPFMDGLGNV
ncbi:MAG: transcriptional regulator [Pseudomonadota bacterium]